MFQSQKFILEWENITVSLKIRKQSYKKTILKNVSGFACNNSLIAIMGPSGSGKTTLLGAISGRLKEKSGTLKINNKIKSNSEVKSISGYIQQQDIFTETLTIKEYLQFMAAMQINDKTIEEKNAFIEKTISELCLKSQKNITINKLSKGEKRRLSLAAELINDPYILFCDEPTTGLDSFSASVIIKKLQTIAFKGKLVIITIHQPSSQLFDYFDNIILLLTGRIVFQGVKEEVKEFFESIKLFCPKNYNPADFYMKCLTENNSKLGKINKKQSEIVNKDFIFKRKVRNSFFYEVRWLTWRNSIDTRRNFTSHLMGFFILSISGLLIATAYAFVKINSENSVQNMTGVLLLIISELIFTNLYAVIYIIPAELTVYLKEKYVYSIYSYFISKLISMIPLCLLNSFSYLLIYFSILSFLKFSQFINTFYILFCTCMAACTLGLSFSSIVISIEYIDLFLAPMEILVMIVSGVWIKINSLSLYLSWIKYLSPFYYAFQSLAILNWQNVHLGNYTASGLPCYRDGTEILENYGFNKDIYTVILNIGYLHILIVFYSIVGFLGILWKKITYNCY